MDWYLQKIDLNLLLHAKFFNHCRLIWLRYSLLLSLYLLLYQMKCLDATYKHRGNILPILYSITITWESPNIRRYRNKIIDSSLISTPNYRSENWKECSKTVINWVSLISYKSEFTWTLSRSRNNAWIWILNVVLISVGNQKKISVSMTAKTSLA